MKIITAYTDNIKDISDISYDCYSQYSLKHNIHFERIQLTNLDRPPSWYKIPLILDAFKSNHDYVMWVDADTLIINNLFNIYNILDHHQIYLSEDMNGINCGVMIWKNTSLNIDILYKLWNMNEFIYHKWWEQAALMELYSMNYNNLQQITKKIPQHIINAYDYRLYGISNHPGQVTANSFIFHLPGIDNNRRLSIMKNFTL